jgi:hypothetical protein
MSPRLALLATLVLTFVACGGSSNYAKSVYGTRGGYSFKNAHATPPSLMVERKIERPLYIVLDAAKVKNAWALDTAPCATGAQGCEHFNVLDVQEFVRRDLKRAMESYFTNVNVVATTSALPSTPHIVADVKIDDLKVHALARGMLTYEIIQMTWGFALRESDKSDYAYSFAGTSESNDSYPTFEAGCGQLIENAMPAMLKKWTESGGIEALRKSGKT